MLDGLFAIYKTKIEIDVDVWIHCTSVKKY